MTFGVNEAMVIQQLHFILQRDTAEEKDGLKSVRMTYADWQRQFPYWSDSTIRRIFDALRDVQVVRFTRTREAAWYAIDYDALSVHLDDYARSERALKSGQIEQNPCKGDEGEEREEEQQGGGRLFGGDDLPAEPPVPDGPDLPALVWERWEQTFPGKTRLGLTPQRRTQLTKALKAVENDLDTAYRAIAGFASWLSAHPDKSQAADIGRVFATGPRDTKNLTDKIIGWANDAPSGVTTAVYLSDFERNEIRRRKAAITEMYVRQVQDEESSPYHAQGHQAITWLKDKYGIEHDADPEGHISYTEPTKKPGDR